jgi:hypothetical protein
VRVLRELFAADERGTVINIGLELTRPHSRGRSPKLPGMNPSWLIQISWNLMGSCHPGSAANGLRRTGSVDIAHVLDKARQAGWVDMRGLKWLRSIGCSQRGGAEASRATRFAHLVPVGATPCKREPARRVL